MANGEIQLADVIGRTGKYQIISTITALHQEVLFGIYFIYLQFFLVDVTLYWDWDSTSENKKTWKSSHCKIEDLIRHNSTSNTSSAQSRLVYDSEYMIYSLTEKFGSVCEKNWLISLTKTLPSAGALFGNIIIGPLCERFGRRYTCVALQVGFFASLLCKLFNQSYIMFAVFAFTSGVCVSPAYVVVVIQVTEFVPNAWRSWYGIVLRHGSVIGQVSISGIAWLLKDWFYVMLIYTVLTALSIPLLWYVLDSPAWLIVRGKEEDARKNVMDIVKRNGRNVEKCERKLNLWINIMKEKQGNQTCAEKGKTSNLFRNRIIAKYTIFITIIKTLLSATFNGFLLNVQSFGSGIYQDIMIMGGLSIATLIVAGTFLKNYSIRNLQIACSLLATVNSIVFIFTYKYDVARLVTGCILRSLLLPISCTCYVYMAELFPTSVRLVGSGFATIFAMAVTIPSPFFKELADKTSTYVPYILFASMTFLCAVLLMLLPETKNRPLIQTVDELVKKKNQSPEQGSSSNVTKL